MLQQSSSVYWFLTFTKEPMSQQAHDLIPQKALVKMNSDSVAVLIVKALLGQGHLLKYPVSH